LKKELLQKLQNVELEILLEVSRVCRENDIEFFLDCGTLLGAARHQGFIPWDDDVDIGMTRESYERFLDIAPRALSDGYFLQTQKTDPEAAMSYAKVRKDNTLYLEHTVQASDMHAGIWIDIFPHDVVSAKRRDLKRMRRRWKIFSKLLTLRVVPRASSWASPIKKVARFVARFPLLPFPKSWFYEKLDSLRIDPEEFDDSALVCFHFPDIFIALDIANALPLSELKFEGRAFPVLNNWEEYLRQAYGDWRQLPPEKERRSHDAIKISFDLKEDEARD
jgi:lipopolysaccharide cholinephosphotransferase